MDLDALVKTITSLLAKALPYLEKGRGKRAEEMGDQLGAVAWEGVKAAWNKLRPKLKEKPSAQEAIEDFQQASDDPDTQAALRLQLKKLLKADPDLAQELADLLPVNAQPITYAAEAHDESVIAQNRSVASGKVAVGRNVQGDVIIIEVNAAQMEAHALWRSLGQPLPPAELTRATGSYLKYVLDRYRYLDFRGMGISDRVPLKLPLLEMYIPLKARGEMPEGETWKRERKRAGPKPSEEEAEAGVQRLSEPQPMLALLKRHEGLIVLGDPGAGKSTFLKFLALTLATGQGEVLGLEARLPVLLPLSAYAKALATQNISLEQFIPVHYRRDLGVELPINAMLEKALEEGGALLLLDGLDEVKDLSQRHLVVKRVEDFFSFRRRAGNKFVLTSRIIGYSEVRPRVEGLGECTLVDLEEEEIELFVDKWTGALERAARGDTPIAAFEAEREREELLGAIRRNPGVRSLAANPLLLTILALMKRQGVTLPERRVELYEKYVETLLKHWNLARSLDGRSGRDLDSVETLRILPPLALWMHQSSPGVGLVKEQELHRNLEQAFRDRRREDPEQAAWAFLNDVREHAGLLVERGGRQYSFIHLTFQEYLAAVALVQKGQQDIKEIVAALAEHVGEDTWHEVSLLTIGYLGIIQQRDEAASAVVEALLDSAPGKPGQAVVLVGEAVADGGEGLVTPPCRQKVIHALLHAMRDPPIEAKRRATAGEVLARLGDPRPEIMTVEAMPFCWVPRGPFLLGSTNDDAMAYDNEKPQQRYLIDYDYWISRFPITEAQFRAFIEDTGRALDNPDSLRNSHNRPVVWVSWPEALSFCDWLTRRWRQQDRLPEGWEVTLPSEPEWEKAARGGLEIPECPLIEPAFPIERQVKLQKNPLPGRRYPWGDALNPERANYDDSEIGEVSAVGCFPQGASPYGGEEMSGNVWEWTRSLWADYPYPDQEKPRRQREDLRAEGRRVLRGGAFHANAKYVRCAYRYSDLPDDRDNRLGFRVVVSPFFLTDESSEL
jgi:formylglycine-generating enzyme required for sulfatase activity